MNKYIAALIAAALFMAATAAQSATAWEEGTNYELIVPAQPTSLPAGKVEVTEVFSYACPACNAFAPVAQKLKLTLPANAVLDYVPAAFNPSEDWPMFQRAYLTAQTLGIAERTHQAMFDAVWKTGELAIVDDGSERLKAHLPTIEDAARFYNRTAGVSVEQFVATSKSFAVDVKINSAEALIRAYAVDRTPTIVVNGKYRLNTQSAGGYDQTIELIKWLVAKESK